MLFALVVAVVPVVMSVTVAIGVDLGVEQLRTVLYAAHSSLQFSIVEDDGGAPSVPTAMAFHKKTGRRLVGQDALVFARRNPAFREPKRLLGELVDSPAATGFKELFPTVTVTAVSEHDPSSTVVLPSGRNTLPEEALAALAADVVRLADVNVLVAPVGGLGGVAPRAVLTAPTFWSAAKQDALKQAFQLGGVDVLDVVDELTAAAVDFTAMQLPTSAAQSTIIIFGAGAVGVGCAVFDVATREPAGAMLVQRLAAEWDGNSGGADVDLALLDALVKDVANRDELLAPAAKIRLREAVREAKDVCLKNSPSCVVSVKELGFERTLTQAAAEAATRVITARMVAPLERLLDRLGSLDVDAKSISGIELFGGASRFTPLQTAAAAVAKRHGLKLGHRLNTELSAAQGAARIAASIVNPTARRVSLVEMQSLPAPGARERATPLSDLSLRLLRGNLAESLALEQTLAARAAARSDFETFLGSASETLEALEASGTNVDAARAALSAQRDFLDLAADESTTVEEFSARLQNLKSVLAQGGGKAKAEL